MHRAVPLRSNWHTLENCDNIVSDGVGDDHNARPDKSVFEPALWEYATEEVEEADLNSQDCVVV